MRQNVFLEHELKLTCHDKLLILMMKSLKMPQWHTEAVDQRKTEQPQEQTTIYNILHKNLMNEQHEPH